MARGIAIPPLLAAVPAVLEGPVAGHRYVPASLAVFVDGS